MIESLQSESRGREGTRERILNVARELFARNGFEATTVKAIADHCGLTDAALYYHFRSKREILDALWEIPRAETLGFVEADRPLTPGRLMELMDAMLDGAAEQDRLLKVMLRQALSGDRVAIELRNQTMAFWKRYLTSQFETALDGGAAAEHADALTMLTFGIVTSAQLRVGDDFPALARSEGFRRGVRAAVWRALPFCRESGELASAGR